MPSWDDDDQLTEDPQTRDLADLLRQQGRPGGPGVPHPDRTLAARPSLPEPRTSHNISNVEIIEQQRRPGRACASTGTPCTSATRPSTPTSAPSFYTIDFSGDQPLIQRKTRRAEERLHPPRASTSTTSEASRRWRPAMTPTRSRFSFEDGVTRFIDAAADDETVADAVLPPRHQHPAGLPRRRLRHLQVPVRIGHVRRRRLHRGRADRGRGRRAATC